MSNINKFSEGASILQQVDVSEIFKSLAMGIAEAQERLDQNSINQVIRLSQEQVAGKSLLELGFAPSFYAFQYADISAKINLKMAMKESMSFGFGLKFNVANKKGYKESDQNFLSENNYERTASEYRSSRTLTFRASEQRTVKIENKNFSLREDLDVKTRVEQMKEDIIRETSVEQVFEEISTAEITRNSSRGIDVFIDSGYLRVEPCICNKKSGVGLLKISDFDNDKAIDVNGDSNANGEFTLGTNLRTTLEAIYGSTGNANTDVLKAVSNASRGLAYGINKQGALFLVDASGTGGSFNYSIHEIPSSVYFKFNKDDINYGDDLKHTSDTNNLTYTHTFGSPQQNKNHNQHYLIHQLLRFIQRNDTGARITITGVTDPVGGKNKHNEQLAERRAKKLKEHIFGKTAPVNVDIKSETNDPGASDLLKRRAEIKLEADYIVFIDGEVNKDAIPAASENKKNKFVFADDVSNGNFDLLNISYAGVEINYTQSSNFSEVIAHIQTALQSSKYSENSRNNYFLHDESIVKLHLFNSESENIDILESSSQNRSLDETEDSFMASETMNNRNALRNSTSNEDKNTTFALSGNLDFRMAKQFEMSVEGTASMSARLVAIPAPDKFMNHIEEVITDNN